MKNNNHNNIDGVNLFEEIRPKILGLAYRILGSMADAEDMVQNTFIKWDRAEQKAIQKPKAWLTTVCTRCCLDLLRSTNNTRVNYIGTWLPEPVYTSNDSELIENVELVQSLTTAFLLMLERLTPKERAAYLLYEIFGTPYVEVAHTLQIKEAACRKLVSRAKNNINQKKIRNVTSAQKQEKFLTAFQLAITSGEITKLSGLLADDIKLNADGGGKVAAILRPVEGKESVIAFIVESLKIYWENCQWEKVEVNNSLGFNLKEKNNIIAILSFSYDKQDQTNGIFIMRNPEKINNLNEISIY